MYFNSKRQKHTANEFKRRENKLNIAKMCKKGALEANEQLVFHLVQAFGTAKGFVYLITKSNNSRNFYPLVNFDKAIWLH